MQSCARQGRLCRGCQSSIAVLVAGLEACQAFSGRLHQHTSLAWVRVHSSVPCLPSSCRPAAQRNVAGTWRALTTMLRLLRCSYGDHTYEQVVLYPMADALIQSMAPTTKVDFVMQGEMGVSPAICWWGICGVGSSTL